MIYKLSELLAFLKSLDASPNHSLSQNFLIDRNVLDKIIAVAKPESSENVLEIGSGPGALTEKLLSTGCHLYAVEKDPLFAEKLTRFPTVTVYCEDFRAFDCTRLPKPCKVVANLPYHLSSPILEKLLIDRDRFTTLTLMLQKEVGEKMVARPGSPGYGSFSLFCQYHAEITYAFTVSPNSFYPKPNVNSCVMHCRLIQREEPYPKKLIEAAFGQKRKTLGNSLKSLYKKEAIYQALEELGKSSTCRAEELSLEEFFSLSDKLSC